MEISAGTMIRVGYCRHTLDKAVLPSNSIIVVGYDGGDVGISVSKFVDGSDLSFSLDLADYPSSGDTTTVSYDGDNFAFSSSAEIPPCFVDSTFGYLLSGQLEFADKYPFKISFGGGK